jgi:hypothetical protein
LAPIEVIARIPAAVGLLAIAALSLQWHMTTDAPLLAYVALAIDRWGLVPYRDIYDFNTAGAYLANLAIGRAFGYTEIGFRIGDLACLTLLGAATAAALKSFGGAAATAGVSLFVLFYLGYGPAMSLQREYFVLLPIAAALATATSAFNLTMRAAVVGVLVGAAATIKPQAAIVLPVFVMWLAMSSDRTNWPTRVRIGLIALAGFAIPLAILYGWLRSIGAVNAFTEIASNYWPLYAELTGARPHSIVSEQELWVYRLNRFVFSRDLRHLIWIPAIAGVWHACRQMPERRRDITLLAGVAFALEIYPLAAGKYWGYHWLPSFYGASLLAALCFIHIAHASRVPRDFVTAAVVVMATAHAPSVLTYWQRTRIALADYHSTAATDIARELRARLQPGETAQPLDWTGGVVHSLFLTQTRIATPFLYDFYFYHHVSTPYIQSLRQRFMRDLNRAMPAFVISADQERRFEGTDTTYEFSELSDFLRKHYHAVLANDRFVIYERNDRAISPRPRS